MRHNTGVFMNIMKNMLIQKNMYLLIFFCLFLVLCPITSFANKGDKVKKINFEKIATGKSKKETIGKDSLKKNDNKKPIAIEKTGLPQKEYTENDFKPQVEEESYGWMVIKTLLVLGLLIAGFYGFFRFVTKRAGGQILGQEVLQTLSILPIGQNKYLQVVDLAGKFLVLGVTESSINLIKEITEKEEIDRIRLLSSKSGVAFQKSFQEQIVTQIGKFVSKVNNIREKKKHFLDEDEKIESGIDLNFLKNQKNRLKNLNGYENE